MGKLKELHNKSCCQLRDYQIEEAGRGDELSSLRYTGLIIEPKLLDYGHNTIFKPGQEGVKVYYSNNIETSTKTKPILRRWQDAASLWCTSLATNQRSTPAKDKGQA